MNLDSAFGHWLSGYLDGEGSFNCGLYSPPSRPGSTNVHVSMSVGARADEKPLLEVCQQTTGLGSLVYRPRQAGPGSLPNGNPCWVWTVQTKPDCQLLVAILSEFPLKSKKSRDFTIWAKIVAEHSLFRPGRKNDLTAIEALVAELRQGRAYDPTHEPKT